VVDIVLWQIHNPTKKLPSDMIADMMKEEEEEVRFFEEEIGALSENKRSPLFVFDNGVCVSTEQLKYREQMTYVEKSAHITGVENAITITD
jgi:hypothetical protein